MTEPKAIGDEIKWADRLVKVGDKLLVSREDVACVSLESDLGITGENDRFEVVENFYLRIYLKQGSCVVSETTINREKVEWWMHILQNENPFPPSIIS